MFLDITVQWFFLNLKKGARLVERIETINVSTSYVCFVFFFKYWGECWYHQGACCHLLSREFHHIRWKPNLMFSPSLTEENNESAKSCVPLEITKLWNLHFIFIFCFMTKQKMKLLSIVCRITCQNPTEERKSLFTV